MPWTDPVRRQETPARALWTVPPHPGWATAARRARRTSVGSVGTRRGARLRTLHGATPAQMDIYVALLHLLLLAKPGESPKLGDVFCRRRDLGVFRVARARDGFFFLVQ